MRLLQRICSFLLDVLDRSIPLPPDPEEELPIAEENLPHVILQVYCANCGLQWIGVVALSTYLELLPLECPTCHHPTDEYVEAKEKCGD
ncbi:MAG TPA: hypothetical protein V6C65_04435 [Allocoleopsis sp.]